MGTIKIVGGYVKPANIGDHRNLVFWHDSIQDYCRANQIKYKYGLDYSLFEGYQIIPRLTLSTGCQHWCKFCTVENEIKEKSVENAIQQIESFKPLDFRLVYLNDKTFGQAINYIWLAGVESYIKRFTHYPNFEGFIIQTTCNQILKPGFIDELKSMNVKYVELGIESFNDSVLKPLRKPQTEWIMHKALDLLFRNDIKIIGNVIIGLPGETIDTYRHTIKMLKMHKFYSLNIYNLALYDDSELSNEIESSGNDSNELIKDRSYHTESNRKAIDWFYDQIFRLGLKIIGDK